MRLSILAAGPVPPLPASCDQREKRSLFYYNKQPGLFSKKFPVLHNKKTLAYFGKRRYFSNREPIDHLKNQEP